MEKAAAEATVPGTNGTAEPGSATAAAAVGTGATTEATGGGAVGAATPNDQISPEVYLGVVKSYNDRRGFGFLACAETAARYGRDVYMPKAEAAQAAAEAAGIDLEALMAANAAAVPSAAAASTTSSSTGTAAVPASGSGAQPNTASGEKEKAEKPPPGPRLAEEDLVSFRVRWSVEGYPQAAAVHKLHKFTGTVVRPPGEDGVDGSAGTLGAITSDEVFEAHGMREVRMRRASCGQVRLAAGDEVTFCVYQVPAQADNSGTAASSGATAGAEDRAAGKQTLEGKLVLLTRTSRSNGSVLGCFTLDLPRTGAGEEAPLRPNLQLDCHAFGDKLILAGLPADLDEKELMRFFSKQGASGTIVARARACSFASVSFPTMSEVARFLGREAHAFADEKETRIAKLLPLAPNSNTARLPALPAPSLAPGEEAGSVLVVWSPLVLAVAYAVELRPAGLGGPWVAVDVGSNRLGASGNCFDSDCSSCKVTGLQIGVGYEGRVSYFTECGTRSEASEASDPCMPTPSAQAPTLGPGLGLAGAEGFGSAPPGHSGYVPQDMANVYQTAPPVPGMPTMGPPAWPAWVGAEGMPPGMGGGPPPMPPPHDAYAHTLPAYIPSPGWRPVSGSMPPPPPSAPELRPADEFGFAVSIQWPAVHQAAAYVVELREAGSAAFERFVRSAPEAKFGSLVELRVGGLRPGPPPGTVYVAQVRTVGADGSESAPSPPGWSPPLPSQNVPGMATSSTSVLSADAAPWQPPSYASGVDGAPPMPVPAPAPAGGGESRTGPLSTPMTAPPMAPPPSGPPPSPPPAAIGNGWAPPPWLGNPQPGGTVLGPLGPCDVPGCPQGSNQGLSGPPPVAPGSPFTPGEPAPASQAPVANAVAPNSTTDPPTMPPPGRPGVGAQQNPTLGPTPVGDPIAPAVGSHVSMVPRAAPPPPPPLPPAGPPSMAARPGQRRDDPPPEITGHEECLILD